MTHDIPTLASSRCAAPFSHDKEDLLAQGFAAALDALEMPRFPREKLEENTVVVCRIEDLAMAQEHYTSQKVAPHFYVLGLDEDVPDDIPMKKTLGSRVHSFAALTTDLDVHMYGNPSHSLMEGAFFPLSTALFQKKIDRYSMEKSLLASACLPPQAPSSAQLKAMTEITARLEDNASKMLFLAVCKARISGCPGWIPQSSFPQYFHPHMPVRANTVVCEGGAADGDSTTLFAKAVAPEGRVYAFEPLPLNYQKAGQALAQYLCATVVPMGLWRSTTRKKLTHSSNNPNGASVGANVERGTTLHTVECDFISVDEYFAGKPVHAIKLDVEGSETAVLRGAAKTLEQYQPDLMLSIYHTQMGDDLLNVPRMVMALPHPYRMYMGHHSPFFWETVLYASTR